MLSQPGLSQGLTVQSFIAASDPLNNYFNMALGGFMFLKCDFNNSLIVSINLSLLLGKQGVVGAYPNCMLTPL